MIQRSMIFAVLVLPTLLLAQERVWDDRFTRHGIVGYSANFDDPDDSALYVTDLLFINGSSKRPVAQFNGTTFEAVGKYVRGMRLTKMVTWLGEKYAAGRHLDETRHYSFAVFKLVNNVWQPLLEANEDLSLLAYGSTLYVFGRFDTLDGQAINGLAAYDGVSVTPIDHSLIFETGYTAPGINGLYPINGRIHVTGTFSRSDSIRFRNIYSFDPQTKSIHLLDSGVNGQIFDLVLWRGAVYATGDFIEAGGSGANKFARWDGLRWSSVGTPRDLVSFERASLLVHKDELLLHGDISSAGRLRPSSIAAWNGVAWSDKYERAGRRLRSIASYKSSLIALFDSVGQHVEICRYEEPAWKPMTFPEHGAKLGLLPLNGYDVYITAMAATKNALYVAGGFHYITPNNDTIRNFAYFDGDEWHGVNDSMPSISKLYANANRVFYSYRNTLGELRDGKFTHIKSFPVYGYITDVSFSENEIIAGLSTYYDEQKTDDPMLYSASLSDLDFKSHRLHWPLQRVRYANGAYYGLARTRLYKCKDDQAYVLWRLNSEQEYFSDISIDGEMFYIAGQFPAEQAFLAKFQPSTTILIGNGVQPYGTSGRLVLRLGERTYVQGFLGYINDEYSGFGYEEGGMFTNMFEAPGGYTEFMVEFKGDLYVSSYVNVDNVQSSGIARLILTEPLRVPQKPRSATDVIYPNPTSSIIRTKVRCAAIYDQLGRRILEVDPMTLEIEVSSLSPGIYYLQEISGPMHRFSVVR